MVRTSFDLMNTENMDNNIIDKQQVIRQDQGYDDISKANDISLKIKSVNQNEQQVLTSLPKFQNLQDGKRPVNRVKILQKSDKKVDSPDFVSHSHSSNDDSHSSCDNQNGRDKNHSCGNDETHCHGSKSCDSFSSVDLSDLPSDRHEYFSTMMKKRQKQQRSKKCYHMHQRTMDEKDIDILLDCCSGDTNEESSDDHIIFFKSLKITKQKTQKILNSWQQLKNCMIKQKTKKGLDKHQPTLKGSLNGSRSLMGHQSLSQRRNQFMKDREIKAKEKLQEHKLEYKQMLKQGIIKFNNPFRIYWDYLIIVLSIYNCIELPIEAAFSYRVQSNLSQPLQRIDNVIDILFFLDIIMNFRTTQFNQLINKEIVDIKEIQINYAKGQFAIDLLSTIPFDLIFSKFVKINQDESQFNLQTMSMLKIIRVIRLNRLIHYMSYAQNIKLSLRLAQSVFLILLYVHICACIWFYIVKTDKIWQPGQGLSFDLYAVNDFSEKLSITLYSSILALLGNDIYPATLLQYLVACFMLLFGAVLQASIFGQVASIIHSMTRGQQVFQQKVTYVNSAMRNLQLSSQVHHDVMSFLADTNTHLNNQTELEEFLKIMSPSLKTQVIDSIFFVAIMKNPIFNEWEDIVDFIIGYVQPKLFMPEDCVIESGMTDKSIYFIAHGKCMVFVQNHLRVKKSVRIIESGVYFGEISTLFGSNRTADVQTFTHCTLGAISQEDIQRVWKYNPELSTSLRNKALEYSDEWINFKVVLLKQIDYFQSQADPLSDQIFKEIQFFMEEQVYQPGSEIIASGEKCTNIYFIVNGTVDLEIYDYEGRSHLLAQLYQGDLIGQYSVLFKEDLSFSVISRSPVRILLLPYSFFTLSEAKNSYEDRHNHHHGHSIKNHEMGPFHSTAVIEGVQDCLEFAQAHVDQFGLPICDFKIYRRTKLEQRAKVRFQNTVRRAFVLQKTNMQAKSIMSKMATKLREMIEQQNHKRAKVNTQMDSLKQSLLSRMMTKNLQMRINQGRASQNIHSKIWDNFKELQPSLNDQNNKRYTQQVSNPVNNTQLFNIQNGSPKSLNVVSNNSISETSSITNYNQSPAVPINLSLFELNSISDQIKKSSTLNQVKNKNLNSQRRITRVAAGQFESQKRKSQMLNKFNSYIQLNMNKEVKGYINKMDKTTKPTKAARRQTQLVFNSMKQKYIQQMQESMETAFKIQRDRIDKQVQASARKNKTIQQKERRQTFFQPQGTSLIQGINQQQIIKDGQQVRRKTVFFDLDQNDNKD